MQTFVETYWDTILAAAKIEMVPQRYNTLLDTTNNYHDPKTRFTQQNNTSHYLYHYVSAGIVKVADTETRDQPYVDHETKTIKNQTVNTKWEFA